MRSIIFDASPIISLTTNNLLWLLENLRDRFKGNFYISPTVKKELVDKPLATKKFKFEALQVLKKINDGVIEVVENPLINEKTNKLLEIANKCFKARGNWIRIVHYGEIESIALYSHMNSDAFVIDERTTRVLIENPKRLVNILRHTLHTNIEINNENLKEFKKLTKDIKIIRSVELVTIAYELGLLNNYLLNIPDPNKTLLDSVLWGVKLNGCAVSKKEIDELIRLEGK